MRAAKRQIDAMFAALKEIEEETKLDPADVRLEDLYAWEKSLSADERAKLDAETEEWLAAWHQEMEQREQA